MNIQEFPTTEKWLEAAIKFIKTLNPKTVALSGGSTPRKLYENWPLPDCDFYQVDERLVPADHRDSNLKLIRETINPAHFHHFDTSLPISEALEKYAHELPESFDLCLLGIGDDGHTASLFPGENPRGKTAHTHTNHFAIQDRLTLTFPEILSSKTILILIKNKPEVLKELKTPTLTAEQFPAHRLKSEKTTVFSC